MLAALKKFILKKYMDFKLKRFKDPSEPAVFPEALRTVKQVLLITPADHPELEGEIQAFASGLYTIFKQVQVSTFDRSSFRPADGNWFGLPNESYLDNFRQEKFDLVIDLNIQQDRLCTYICALINAPLRMNLCSGDYDHIYNFHIRTNKMQPDVRKLEKMLANLKKFMQ